MSSSNMEVVNNGDVKPDLDNNDKRKESTTIIKNILLVSFVFTLNFTAFKGLSQLQSSLHTEESLGTVTQTILYIGFLLSCLFLPKVLIQIVGHKWSIALAIVGYII